MAIQGRKSVKVKLDGDVSLVDRLLQLLLFASVALNVTWLSREASVPRRQSTVSPLTKLVESQPRDNTTENVKSVLQAFGDDVKIHREQKNLAGKLPELSDQEIRAKLTIGGKPCETDELHNLVKFLHNIVLIININYDDVGRKTAGFLRQVYGRFFDHVVLIGPNAIPEVGIEARGHAGLREVWPYAYFHLPAIFARYPGAEGFLWTNDDVVINYWNLLSANKTKLWLPVTPECPSCHHFVPFQAGIPEDVIDGWSGHPETRQKSNRALSKSDLKYIFQYRESILPREEGYLKQVVDCFYIPHRLTAALSGDLLPIFRDNRVPSEIAIPMMFNALEHPKEYDEIFRKMVYRWERGPLYDPRKYWNASLGAYHHWKLSSPELQKTLLEALGSRDGCLKHFDSTKLSQARGHPKVRDAWQYAYFYLPAVMARYPKAEGFMWTNDDVVLNYWNFMEADKSKLWLSDCPGNTIFVPFQTNLLEDRNDGWSALAVTRRSAMLALSRADVKYIYQHRESILPRKEGYAKRVADCFFIPRRFVEPLSFDLIPVFRDHMVWSEIAIPMMFYSLDNPASFDPVFSRMMYVWERGPLYDPRKFWHAGLAAYHHWKIASPQLKDWLVESMSFSDPCLRNLIANFSS